MADYGKKGQDQAHMCRGTLPWPRNLPLTEPQLVGQTGAGIAKVVSGVKVELRSFFQDHFIAARWVFLIAYKSYLLLQLALVCFFLIKRWKYVPNGKLRCVHFCVWMAVTPGVWVSWPTRRRDGKLHCSAGNLTVLHGFFLETVICPKILNSPCNFLMTGAVYETIHSSTSASLNSSFGILGSLWCSM